MDEILARTIRVARRVRERLLGQPHRHIEALRHQLRQATFELQRLAALEHRLDLCVRRDLLLAAEGLRSEVDSLARDLSYLLQCVQGTAQASAPAVPALRDLTEELRQLRGEFGSWEYVAEEHVLHVSTDVIELEGIELGPFQIRLDLQHSDVAVFSSLRVVALDPRPATSNSSVTHPHVSDDILCGGDAAAAMEAAMSEGRLCDLFMLARSVLEHYNPHSAYVPLSEWDGEGCSECGHIVNEDDRYCCPSCESVLCSECGQTCNGCEDIFCGGCLHTCEFCDERTCRECLKTCPCGKQCCSPCLIDGLCPACYQKKEIDHEQETPPTSEKVPAPALSGAAT